MEADASDFHYTDKATQDAVGVVGGTWYYPLTPIAPLNDVTQYGRPVSYMAVQRKSNCHNIGTWCNGSTGDFDSPSSGSNPDVSVTFFDMKQPYLPKIDKKRIFALILGVDYSVTQIWLSATTLANGVLAETYPAQNTLFNRVLHKNTISKKTTKGN